MFLMPLQLIVNIVIIMSRFSSISVTGYTIANQLYTIACSIAYVEFREII